MQISLLSIWTHFNEKAAASTGWGCCRLTVAVCARGERKKGQGQVEQRAWLKDSSKTLRYNVLGTENESPDGTYWTRDGGAWTCVTHGGDAAITSALASSNLCQPVFPADRASKLNLGLWKGANTSISLHKHDRVKHTHTQSSNYIPLLMIDLSPTFAYIWVAQYAESKVSVLLGRWGVDCRRC